MTTDFQDEMISSYLDEELTPEQREVVEQQLVRKPEQERILADFQAIRGLLQDLPVETVPGSMAPAIQQLIEQHKSAAASSRNVWKISPRRWVVWLGTCSAAVCLLAVGWYSWELAGGGGSLSDSLVMHHPMQPSEMMEMASTTTAPALGILEEAETVIPNSLSSQPRPMSAPLSAPTPAISSAGAGRLSVADSDNPQNAAQIAVWSDSARGALMSRLEQSPKLSGKLAPGELVHYITVEDDEIAVIELNVVDIDRSFGEVQVLLAGNAIAPAEDVFSQQREKTRSADQLTNQVVTENAENVSASAETELAAIPKNVSESGLVAFYVEASDTQFLQALEQMESLDSVKSLQIGDSTLLSGQLYSVVHQQIGAGAVSAPEQQLSVVAAMPLTENESVPFLLEQQRATRDEKPMWRRSANRGQTLRGGNLLQSGEPQKREFSSRNVESSTGAGQTTIAAENPTESEDQTAYQIPVQLVAIPEGESTLLSQLLTEPEPAKAFSSGTQESTKLPQDSQKPAAIAAEKRSRSTEAGQHHIDQKVRVLLVFSAAKNKHP